VLNENENENSFETDISRKIITAYVSNNKVSKEELPNLINSVMSTVNELSGKSITSQPVNQKPAVSIKKSLQHTHLVCLEDGLEFKSLKRHLRTKYNLTPEQYRSKWGLQPDYPMVAPAYAEVRSSIAKNIGLGAKRT